MDKSLHHHEYRFGKRASEKIASIVGSWTFLIVQTAIIIIWLVVNAFRFFYHWDEYPFAFLDTFVDLVAVSLAPILLMTQNRVEERDRRKMEMDYLTDKKEAKEVDEIKTQLNRIEKEKLDKIMEILRNK